MLPIISMDFIPWAPIGEHRSVLRFVGRVEKVRAEPVQVLQDLNLPPR